MAELHQGKYEAQLHEIENRVFFPVGKLSKLEADLDDRDLAMPARPRIDPQTEMLRLRAVIPTSELFCSDMKSEDKIPPMVVGKYGSTTGLTFGVANAAKSVLCERFDDDTAPTKCDEWCIFSVNGKDPFGWYGDSGASVWDMSGRIGGMLTRGTEHGDAKIDVVYVAPMEWVLDDIRSRGFVVNDP